MNWTQSGILAVATHAEIIMQSNVCHQFVVAWKNIAVHNEVRYLGCLPSDRKHGNKVMA